MRVLEVMLDRSLQTPLQTPREVTSLIYTFSLLVTDLINVLQARLKSVEHLYTFSSAATGVMALFLAKAARRKPGTINDAAAINK